MSTDDTTPVLPELSAERIDELEEALFDGIARERRLERAAERRDAQRRMRRRRAVWWTTAAAAVVVIGAVAIGPTLGRLGTQGAGGSTADESAQNAPDAPVTGDGVVGQDDSGLAGGSAGSDGSGSVANREIVATAQATVRVDDVAAAAQQIGAAAAARGGYVESMNVGQQASSAVDGAADEGAAGGAVDGTLPAPDVSGAWVTVRVPADQLTGAIDELSQLGTVEASSITRQDVTAQAVDLRARIDALQASVDRLTQLMGKAGTVGDLITAESALSQRQADLESYQQQLKALESQVSMSSLTVSLVEKTQTVAADPAGFADGLAAGWNGLVATLNGLVVAVGFLLPWLIVVLVGGAVWWIVRARRGRRVATTAPRTDVGDPE